LPGATPGSDPLPRRWMVSDAPRPVPQIAAMWDKSYVCATLSAVALNTISLLSSALSAMTVVDKVEKVAWFSGAILQLCQPARGRVCSSTLSPTP